MRSGSSLLTHILNTNPEIIGYGETHIEYESEADLKTLLLRLYLMVPEFRQLQDLQNLRMHHRYVLDKVLHDKKLIDYSFLSSQRIYSIFLLREPERSLTSILDLKPHWTEEIALKYYCDRLQMLETYARFINSRDRTLFITYEQLLDNTNSVLSKLQEFLKTKHIFLEQYSVLKTTGLCGVGDSKGNIKAGRIIRTVRELSTTVGVETMNQARAAFEHCSQTLSDACTVL